LAVISYEIALLNGDAPIAISSELVYQQKTRPAAGNPQQAAFAERVLLSQSLQSSDAKSILTAMKERLLSSCS
jgi:predicted component of type VI protein secretion system